MVPSSTLTSFSPRIQVSKFCREILDRSCSTACVQTSGLVPEGGVVPTDPLRCEEWLSTAVHTPTSKILQ